MSDYFKALPQEVQDFVQRAAKAWSDQGNKEFSPEQYVYWKNEYKKYCKDYDSEDFRNRLADLLTGYGNSIETYSSEPKCECGATKTKQPCHSTWCPCYKEEEN